MEYFSQFEEGDIVRLKSDCFGPGFIYEGYSDSDVIYAEGHMFDESISNFRNISVPERVIDKITDTSFLPAVSERYCEGDVVRLRLQPEVSTCFTISERLRWNDLPESYKIKVCWRDGALYKESNWLPEQMFIVIDINKEQLNLIRKDMLKKYEKETPVSKPDKGDYRYYPHTWPSTVSPEYPLNPRIWCGPATVESKGFAIDYMGGNYTTTIC